MYVLQATGQPSLQDTDDVKQIRFINQNNTTVVNGLFLALFYHVVLKVLYSSLHLLIHLPITQR